MAFNLPKARDYTDDEISIVSKILSKQHTPVSFREALLSHPFLSYVGQMFLSLTMQKLERKRTKSPVEAELQAMKEIQLWWLKEMTEKDRNRLQRKYAEANSQFFINLTMHTPSRMSEAHWQMLENGIAPRLYKKTLSKLLSPEVVAYIDSRIQELGVYNIFDVRIMKEEGGSFSVGVQIVSEDEFNRRRALRKKK